MAICTSVSTKPPDATCKSGWTHSPEMGTQSRERIHGSSVRASPERVHEARKLAREALNQRMLPKILNRETNCGGSMNSFDCADASFVTEERSRRRSFMLEAIAAMVVVLGIGFLMAHALDAFRY
jgi:hypothetical protein